MNLQTILNQFTGSVNAENAKMTGMGDRLGQIGNFIPGGLAGGAVAGGIMAMLLSNKSARKFAGSAATYGGAALIGGLAYKAYKNWQQSQQNTAPISENSFASGEILSTEFQLTLIKAMIASAQADGYINATERQNILVAIDKMETSSTTKTLIIELLRRPITLGELEQGTTTLEQKSEVYIVSCMIAGNDQPSAMAYLSKLARVLDLPNDLAQQLQLQAQQTIAAA